MKRVALICLSLLLVIALTLDASAFRGGGGGGFRGGGGGVYRGGGGAGAIRGPGGAARFVGRWAAAWQEDRPAEPLCVGRWVVVPLSVRAEVLQYADRWAVPLPWAQAEVPQYADRWEVPLPWAQAEVLQYADRWEVVPRLDRQAMSPRGGLPATSQSVPTGHIRTFMAAPILIMVTAPPRQVLP